MRSTSYVALAVAACLILASGCDSDADAGADADNGGDRAASVPITKKAIAAVLLEHLPPDPIERSGTPRSVELTYWIDDSSAGNEEEVEVSISGATGDPCARMGDALTGCEVEKIDDGELTVYWQEEQPFEDPGILYLVMVREDDSVTLEYSGVLIESDPRKQEFVRFTFEDMVDAVTDPRLGLTTTQDAVDAGAELEWP